MIKNLIFALLFAYSLTSCQQYPQTYTDATGVYTHIKGNRYHKKGDKLTHKGYREYKLVKDKGFSSDPSQIVVK